MQDAPSSPEIIDAISSLLKERILPKLEGHDVYALRVAINSLGIVKREFENRSDMEVGEKQRLELILGHSGTLEELNSELCKKIRDGDFTLSDKPVLEHLKQTAMDQVTIDQPKYSGLIYAREQRSECQTTQPPAP